MSGGLHGWARVSYARAELFVASTALHAEAVDAVRIAVQTSDGWLPTVFGEVGAVWRYTVGIRCQESGWFGVVYYDDTSERLGPFDTALEAAKAVAASGLDIGDFLTAHPWLAPEVPS